MKFLVYLMSIALVNIATILIGVIPFVNGQDNSNNFDLSSSTEKFMNLSTANGTSLSDNATISSGPAVSSWGPDHLNVFVLGSDGALWNNPYFNNAWHQWTHTGN